MLDALTQTFGLLPMPAQALAITSDCVPEQSLTQARALLSALDQGQGCLVFTDIFGATPSNIAHQLASEDTVIIAGLNLPMLFRVLNYPQSDLETLAEKAVNAGYEGITNSLEAGSI
jgi:PTS system ascorbate-specific IIA component